mmetsp:Transcript_5442/g.13332  ORF Transcript_5442/g.13332 Transcript_5442/m.13332 type:complete len:85 (-) Transcript_5442:97-351(-)
MEMEVDFNGIRKTWQQTCLHYTVGQGLIDYDWEKHKKGRHYWKICNGFDECRGPLINCYPRCRKRQRDHFHKQNLAQEAKATHL